MSSEEPKLNLKQKIAAIRREIHKIEKGGFNEHFKYKYVEGSELQGEMGTALAERNIILGRRGLTVAHQDGYTTVQCEYGLLDADSNEELWYDSAGEEKGDKAIFKAWTGCMKYFLMQAFSLRMGDDPEKDEKDAGHGRPKQEDGMREGAEAPTSSRGEKKKEEAVPLTPDEVSEMLTLLIEAYALKVNASNGKPFDLPAALTVWGCAPVEGLERLGQDDQVDLALYAALGPMPRHKWAERMDKLMGLLVAHKQRMAAGEPPF